MTAVKRVMSLMGTSRDGKSFARQALKVFKMAGADKVLKEFRGVGKTGGGSDPELEALDRARKSREYQISQHDAYAEATEFLDRYDDEIAAARKEVEQADLDARHPGGRGKKSPYADALGGGKDPMAEAEKRKREAAAKMRELDDMRRFYEQTLDDIERGAYDPGTFTSVAGTRADRDAMTAKSRQEWARQNIDFEGGKHEEAMGAAREIGGINAIDPRRSEGYSRTVQRRLYGDGRGGFVADHSDVYGGMEGRFGDRYGRHGDPYGYATTSGHGGPIPGQGQGSGVDGRVVARDIPPGPDEPIPDTDVRGQQVSARNPSVSDIQARQRVSRAFHRPRGPIGEGGGRQHQQQPSGPYTGFGGGGGQGPAPYSAYGYDDTPLG